MADYATPNSAFSVRRARRGHVLALLATALLALAVPVLRAQQPTPKPSGPDTSVAAQFQQVAGMFNQMGPMYETMMRSMVEGTLKALADSANVERLAVFSRRYYLALVRQGFTREEALQIVAGVHLPLSTGR
jgi:hypothetical protein